MVIKVKQVVLLAAIMLGLSACTPETGSQAWCEMMDKKAKGDWSANDVSDYAKHCIFKQNKN
ncbi:MAG: DUF3012 domain-containing protein [Ferrimonas sp.]